MNSERMAADSPDEALARAAAAGDGAAFACLVRRYVRKAMAVAAEYTPSLDDAEDVVQESFRRAHAGLARFDSRRDFAPWFFTIVRNTAVNAYRQQRRKSYEPLTGQEPSRAPGPQEMLHRRELRRRIEAAVSTLPARQQECFRLCVVEGLTSAEAAAALDVAESTVRVQVFRARQTLQPLLSEWREETEVP